MDRVSASRNHARRANLHYLREQEQLRKVGRLKKVYRPPATEAGRLLRNRCAWKRKVAYGADAINTRKASPSSRSSTPLQPQHTDSSFESAAFAEALADRERAAADRAQAAAEKEAAARAVHAADAREKAAATREWYGV